jgi:translocation and assembly module TamB
MLRRDFAKLRSPRPITSTARLRAGGAKRKLLIFLALVAGIVALLPTIIAKTPLRNSLLSAVVPGNSVHVSIGSASLSWVSGPVLSVVQVVDAAGNPLLTADAITIDRTPLNLLTNMHDCGVVAINRPQIYLKLRPDGSNVEDALQQLLAEITKNAKPAADRPNARAPFAYAIQIVDGTVNIEDATTGRASRIDGLNVQYDCHGAGGGLGNGSLAGQLAIPGPNGSPIPAGRFALTLKPNGNRSELGLQAEAIALTTLQPFLNRFAPGTQLGGTLAGNGSASWTTSANAATDFATTGAFAIDQLEAASPALQGDHIRLTRVELPWRVTSQPAGLIIEDLQLKSDAGQIAIRGRLDPAIVVAPQNITPSSLALSGNNDIELKGAVDVARLATMLPRAAHLRGDVSVTSGSIELAGRMQPTTAGQSFTGSVRTSKIAATNAGKPFTWDQPVVANFAITRSGSALALDTLQCDSKFLRVQASGTLQKLTAEANFDLNSLADQLGQFIDLSHTQLAGNGTAQFAWQQVDGNKFSATATSDLSQLRVLLSDGTVWAEPQLGIKAEATGSLDAASHRPTSVEAAQLQINGQGDQLDARLISSVPLNADIAFPIAIRSTGSIARWLTRAKPWFATGTWQIDGASEITANIRATNTVVDITDTKITVNNLQANSPGWSVNEPRAEFAGDAHYNRATGEIAANSTQFVSSTISIAAKDLHFAASDHCIAQLGGVAAFRADVGRLASWRAPTNAPIQYQPTGDFTGNIRFAQQSGQVTGEITATAQNLVLASRGVSAPGAPATSQTIWQEPRLILHALTNYDSNTDRATFDQFQIKSNTLQANASGQIEHVSTVAQCNVNGALNYDLEQVSPLLRPYLGEGIQLNGREQAHFQVAGQLLDSSGPSALKLQPVSYAGQPPVLSPQSATSWSRRIHAQLELPWGGANVYGLPVGPGKLAATLGDGAIQIAPIALAVGEGQLNLAPTIRFDPEPAELTMPAGQVVNNVRISPEVSEAMLKYVAPVLAGATQSEGQFSLQLDGLRAPLADTKKATSSGKLTVHSVRVVPGPTTEQWVGLAQQIQALVKRSDAQPNQATLLSIRDQQVNFKVTDGRVYHQNIEFQIGDVVMRSQGSVGLTDETISLTLQIPIQDDWVAKNPILAGLKGQTLQIPVSGTLKRPQMDKRALANISGQLIQNAAGSQINKALDKFLKPRQ